MPELIEFKLNFYDAVLHTSTMTEDRIRAEAQQEISDDEIQNAVKIFKLMDGKRAIVAPEYGGSGYVLIGLEDDNQNRELSYQMEQDEECGCYINQREKFDADYSNGEYSSDFEFVLNADLVEIISSWPPEING